jgi:hypothetical protein
MPKNDITGDSLHTGSSTDAYRDGWDRIFGKKEEPVFHLRSYGDVTEQELIELTKKEPFQLPQAAFFLMCIEYERGWGSKPDGYLAFASEEQAHAYRDEQYKDRTNKVPDYYENYEDAGWHPLSEKNAMSLMTRSDRPYLYFDHIRDAAK